MDAGAVVAGVPEAGVAAAGVAVVEVAGVSAGFVSAGLLVGANVGCAATSTGLAGAAAAETVAGATGAVAVFAEVFVGVLVGSAALIAGGVNPPVGSAIRGGVCAETSAVNDPHSTAKVRQRFITAFPKQLKAAQSPGGASPWEHFLLCTYPSNEIRECSAHQKRNKIRDWTNAITSWNHA